MKDPIVKLEEKYNRHEEAGTLTPERRETYLRRMRQLMEKPTHRREDRNKYVPAGVRKNIKPDNR